MTKPFDARLEAVKKEMSFSEVAIALNLKGSQRGGFDCPKCGGYMTLKVRPDGKGGRCSIARCGGEVGFDHISLVRVRKFMTPAQALGWLEHVIREKQRRSDHTFDMFGGKDD